MPVDIQVTDRDTDGRFEPGDRVVFYAEPYAGRYETQNTYWFTFGGTGGPRMGTRTVAPTGAEPVVTEITRTLHIENNVDYRSAYHRPENADHWFDDVLYPAGSNATVTRTYDLVLDGALTGGGRQLELVAVVHGGAEQAANPDQSVLIRLNAHDAGLYQWEGSTDHTIAVTLPAAWLDARPNRLSLVAALAQLPSLAYYWISPDYVELTYPALADAGGTDRLHIGAVAPGANQIRAAGFTTPAVGVYDIRDPRHPVQLMTTAYDGGAATLSFWDADLPAPTYYLSTEDALLAPAALERDTPSDWGTPAHEADYIAIVHHDLWRAIDPLLAHRADPAGDNFRVAKVDVQDIYDEFSGGRRDPEAIRAFLILRVSPLERRRAAARVRPVGRLRHLRLHRRLCRRHKAQPDPALPGRRGPMDRRGARGQPLRLRGWGRERRRRHPARHAHRPHPGPKRGPGRRGGGQDPGVRNGRAGRRLAAPRRLCGG